MRMDRYKEEYEEQQRKAKRKRILLVLIFLFIVIVAAEVFALLTLTSIDRSFPRSVERALYEEWETSGNDMQMKTKGHITDTSFIDLELEKVSEYANKQYKDDELSRIADEYITALEDCQKAASEHDPNTDADAFWAAFSEPYGRRLKAIYKLNSGEFHFTPDKKKFEAESSYVLAQGWLLNATESLSFTRSNDGKSTSFYTTLKNDSGLGIEYLDLEIELLDATGKLKETSSVYVTDIDNGESVRLKFVSTSDKAAKYRIASETCKFREKEVESDEA